MLFGVQRLAFRTSSRCRRRRSFAFISSSENFFSFWIFLVHFFLPRNIFPSKIFFEVFAFIASIVLYCGVRDRHLALRRAVNKNYSPCSQQEDDITRPAWDTVS